MPIYLSLQCLSTDNMRPSLQKQVLSAQNIPIHYYIYPFICVGYAIPYTTDKSVTDLLQICYVCCISVTELSQINRVFTDLLYICHYTVDNYKLHFVQIYYRACT